MDAPWLRERPFAHRGLFVPGVPENSLAAFESAVRSGCGVELDVMLGGDDVVVFHDVNLARLTGLDADVLSVSPSVLSTLRLDGTSEHIPTLQEALAVLGSTPVIVELKPEPGALLRRELVSRVVRIVSRHVSSGGVAAIHSFDPKVLRLLVRHAPHLPRGAAAGELEGSPLQRLTRDRYLSAPVTKPSFVAHNAELLPAPRVSSLRSWGIPVLAWTTRTRAELDLVAFEVDNVIAEGEALSLVLSAGGFEAYRSGLSAPRLGWRWPFRRS